MRKPVLQLIPQFVYSFEESHKKNSMMRDHYHNVYEIYFQADGVRYVYFNNLCYKMSRGDILITQPFIFHRTESKDSDYYKRFVINFSLDDLKCLFSDDDINYLSEKLSTRIIKFNDNLIDTLCGYMKRIEYYNAQTSSISEKLKFAELFQFLDFICTHADENNVINTKNELHTSVFKAIDYVRTHYNDDIDLDFISHYSGLSKSQFCKAFKENTGTTFLAYLNNYRISQAYNLIVGTNHPLHTIADMCGFYSTEHMTRHFNSYFGQTPSEIRKTGMFQK